jgi:hypothetical protein
MGLSASVPSSEPTLYQKATGAIASAANSVKNTVTSIVPGAAAATAPPSGVAPEDAGVTSGGGRRRTRKGRKGRKTRRGGRKH